MHGEVPVCTRCCMCLPLRYGIIVWGYVRLVVSLLLVVGIGRGFYETIRWILNDEEKKGIFGAVLIGMFLLLAITDVVLNLILIVGGHMKNEKFLRVYYIYSIVLWVLMVLLGGALTIHGVYVIRMRNLDLVSMWLLIVDVTTLLAQIIIQAYFTLLVRSEIVKLQKNCEFRFVNNAADSECVMKCAEINEDNNKVPVIGNNL